MNEAPGQRDLNSGYSPREVFLSRENIAVLPGITMLDSANAYAGANTNRVDEILAGTLMAKVTATNKWVPVKRTTVASGGGSSVTTCVLTDASHFKVGDTITIGTDDVTILTINYSTRAITFSSVTIADGEAVVARGTLAGAQTARAILADTVRLLPEGDRQTTWRDHAGVLAISGVVDVAMVKGDLAACRADTSAQLAGFLWSDRQNP